MTPQPETMLERMARAMFACDVTDGMFEDERGHGLPAPAWDSALGRGWQPRFLAAAQAALDTLAEPTNEMVEAGLASIDTPTLRDTVDVQAIFTAMIKAAGRQG